MMTIMGLLNRKMTWLMIILMFFLGMTPLVAVSGTEEEELINRIDFEPISQSSSTIGTQSLSSSSSPIYGLLNSIGLNQNQFQNGDLNLTQGAVRLSEMDLRLPGKNGLDLIISRTYNSRFYRSHPSINPTEAKMWGAYAGQGWSFNVGMRAYIVQLDSDDTGVEHQISIDYGGTIDTFYLDSATGKYISKTPGKFDFVEKVGDSGYAFGVKELILHTEAGREIVFASPFFYTAIEPIISGVPIRHANVKGFYVTEMKDLSQNKIQFSYETFKKSISKDALDKVAILFGKDVKDKFYDLLIEYYPFYASGWRSGNFKRLSQIVDSFGRTVNFHYEEAHNQGPNTDDVITSITYTNTNGTESKIKYSTNTDGQLSSVQFDNLPPKQYTYKLYDLGNDDEDGFLLEKNKSALGSEVEYQYTVSGEMDGNGTIKDYHHIPVIKKKIVRESSTSQAGAKTWVYEINYPVNSDNQPKGTTYSPSWEPENTFFYFDSIEIDNPSEIEDEEYIFENGLLNKQTRGIAETLMDWDLEKSRKKEIIVKKNGVIQSQQEFEEYDSYNNPTSILTKKGTEEVVRQINTYYNDTAFIENNLVHLVKSTTSTDLSTNKSRSSFNVFYDSGNSVGKLKERYKGSGVSGTKLSSFTYDDQGRVKTVTAHGGPEGSLETSYSYSESGSKYIITKTTNNKSSVTTHELNTGKPTEIVDTNGSKTSYTYDDYGRVTNVVGQDGRTKTWSYADDLKSTSVSAHGRTVTTIVDNFGRTIKKDYPSGEQDVEIEYYFGGKIDKLYVIENGTRVEKKDIDYDSYLRKKSVTKLGWNTVSYDYDSDSDWTVSDVTVTDYKGRNSTSYSDSLGRQTKSHYAPDNSEVVHSYDNFGGLLKTVDSKGLFHDVDYDDYGQVIHSYYTYKNGSKVKRSTTDYYDNGMLKSVTTFKENGSQYKVFTYDYDSQGRLVDTKVNNVSKATITYDGSGQSNGVDRLTAAENGDAKSVFDYDEMGRLIKETTTIKAINKTVAIETDYTQTDQVKEMRYTDGKKVSYGYDSHHRVNSIAYDGNMIATYTYNENGTVDYMTYGNGMVVDYTYEREGDSSKRDGLITKIEAKKSLNGEPWYYESYTYDEMGNMLTNNRLHSISQEEGQKSYTYNNRDELVKIGLAAASLANGNNANFKSYAYDLNGNIKTFGLPGSTANSPITTTRQINSERDQIQTVSYPNGKSMAISYDPDGNLTKKTITRSGVTTEIEYDYDDFNGLKRVKKDGAIQAEYGYDSNGLMVYSKVTDPASAVRSGQKYYYWGVGGQCIGEGHTSYGDHIVRYIYSGNEKIAMVRPKDITNLSAGEEIYWFINNLQGTPIRIVDKDKKKVSSIELDEWGNPNGSIIGNRSEINFTGKKYEPVTGLIYFGARFYDPELGVFLSEDPAGQYSNPYLYGANSPLMYVDPDGEWFFTTLLTIIAPGIGTGLGAAIDTALWAGTASAAISVGVQYAATGTVDWGQVGTSFVRGTIMGGIGAAASALGMSANFAATGIEWLDKAVNVGIVSGASNAVYTGLWEKDKNMLESFGVGFGVGFAGSAVASGIGALTSKQAGTTTPPVSDTVNDVVDDLKDIEKFDGEIILKNNELDVFNKQEFNKTMTIFDKGQPSVKINLRVETHYLKGSLVRHANVESYKMISGKWKLINNEHIFK